MPGHDEKYLAEYSDRIVAPEVTGELRTIHLAGSLEEAVGAESVTFMVSRPCELFRALGSQYPQCLPIFRDSDWRIYDAESHELDLLDLFTYRPGLQPDLWIVPSPEGAGDSGIGKIFGGLFLMGLSAFVGPLGLLGIEAFSANAVLGAGALMALSGVSQALAPTQLSNFMDREEPGVRQSSLFSGSTTLAQPGEPVPIVYGTARTGGLRASSLIQSSREYDWRNDSDLISVASLEIVDVLSEGTIEDLEGDREGVLLDGVPLASSLSGDSAAGLTYVLVDGSSATGGNVSAIGKIRNVNRLVDAANSATVSITDADITRASITLLFNAIFESSTTVPPQPTSVEFTVEVDADVTGSPGTRTGFVSAAAPVSAHAVPLLAGGYVWNASHPPSSAPVTLASALVPFPDLYKFDLLIRLTYYAAFPVTPQAEQSIDLFWRAPGGSGAWNQSTYSGTPVATGTATGPLVIYTLDIQIPAISLPTSATSIEAYADTTPTTLPVLQTLEFSTAHLWTAEGKIEGRALAPYEWDIDLPDLAGYGQAPFDIKVTRTTADLAASSLSRDQFKFSRYVEIIGETFDYANTATVKVTGTSDALGNSIPRIDYIVKGRKVRLPTGYTAATNQMPATWAGTFQATRQYTTDPAWILYDLLTDERGGLGLADSDIDKWSFGEASTRNGDMVDDWKGGTELRYQWNGAITRRDQAYKILQNVASCMDAQIWVGAGTVYLTQDRPGSVSRVFTEANVIAGRFEYVGTAATGRPTIARVSWRDPEELYEAKIETQERQFGIDRFGRREIDVDAPGVTSLGQAMRRAKYVLLTNERETQQLRFKVGSENALMTVGDLIEVQDSHRNEARYGGRTTYQYSFWGLNVFEIDQDPAIPPITGVTVSPYGDIMTVTTDTGAIRSGGIYVTYSPPTYNPSVVMVNGTAGGWATTNRTFITRPQSATPRIYRVLSLSEDEPGVYEVAAIEHDASKWSAIEDPSETGAAFAYPSDVWPPP